MALVTKDFRINITPGEMPPTVHVSEYDIGRAYNVTLTGENGSAFEIPSGTTATVEGTLNGTVGFTTSATISNNQITFALTESMTAYSGKAWCKIKLTLNDEPIQTCAFVLAVDRAGVEAETVLHSPGFQEQINEGIAEYFDNDPPFFELPSGGQSGQALLSDGNGGAVWGEAGIPEAVKTTLLDCFANVAWANNQGQTFYNALYAALYNSTPPPTPSPVPSEYQRVEWVGTDNNAIAYIEALVNESGMAALAGYSITMKVAFGKPVASQGNGTVLAFSSKAGTYFGSISSGYVAIGANASFALPSSIVCTDMHEYKIDFSETGMTVLTEGLSVSRNYSTSGDTAQSLKIGTGSIDSNNVAEWTKFYDMIQIGKNGTLVGKLYPVYRLSDGVIGFYDSVRNEFFANSGSGSFVKGGDVS